MAPLRAENMSSRVLDCCNMNCVCVYVFPPLASLSLQAIHMPHGNCRLLHADFKGGVKRVYNCDPLDVTTPHDANTPMSEILPRDNAGEGVLSSRSRTSDRVLAVFCRPGTWTHAVRFARQRHQRAFN